MKSHIGKDSSWNVVMGNPSGNLVIIDPSDGEPNFLVEAVKLIEMYFTPDNIIDYISRQAGNGAPQEGAFDR